MKIFDFFFSLSFYRREFEKRKKLFFVIVMKFSVSTTFKVDVSLEQKKMFEIGCECWLLTLVVLWENNIISVNITKYGQNGGQNGSCFIPPNQLKVSLIPNKENQKSQYSCIQ